MDIGTTRVYRYGLLAPSVGAAVALEQLRRAHHYHNARIAIERARRAEIRAGVLSPRPQAAYRALLARAGEHGEEPVFWGHRQLVDDACARSWRALPLAEDPRFTRFAGTGALGIQVQGGMDAAALAADARVSVRMVDDPRSGRRRGSRAVLRMRIAAGDVCAEWPMTMHRPLPPDADIRAVRVVLRRVGPREIWEVMLTCRVAEHAALVADGVVALHCGWRKMADERRVGYWLGSDGAREEVHVPAVVLSGAEKAASLRAIRDKSLPAAREAVGTGEAAVTLGVLRPEERPQQWRSPARFAALAKRWRRVDPQGAALLESWRYRDHHLWAWESEQRARSLLHREERFRVLGARLATRYHTLVVEKIDLTKMAMHGPAGGGRVQSGPSRMRAAVITAFCARGGRVVEVSSVWITGRCVACGHVEEVPRDEVEHTCGGCGAAWDRDANAASNMLERERSGDGAERATEPKRKLRLPRRQTRAAREAAQESAE